MKKVIIVFLIIFVSGYYLYASRIDSLKIALQSTTDIPEQIELLNQIGDNQETELSEKLKLFKQAEELAISNNVENVLSEIYLNLFYYQLKTQDYKILLNYLEKMCVEARKIGEKEYADKLLWYYPLTANYVHEDLGIKKIKEAKTIFKKLNCEEEEIEARYYLGNLYQQKQDFDNAILIFDSLLTFDDIDKYQDTQFKIRLNIANIYSMTGQPEFALQYCNENIDFAIKSGEQAKISDAYNQLSVTYIDAKDFPNAIKTLLEMEKIVIVENLDSSHYNNLGLSYSEVGEFGKAIENLTHSIELLGDNHPIISLANTEINLAKAYFGLGDYEKAKSYLYPSLEKIDADKNILFYLKGLDLSYRLEKKNGNNAKALEALEKYHKFKTKLTSEELKNRIADLNAKYQDSQKNKEIELLKKNEQIQRVELRRSKQIRDILLVVVIIFIGLITVIIRSRKKQKIMNTELKIQKEEIEKAYKNIKSAQNEIINLEKNNALLAMNVTANHEINQPLMILQGNLEMIQFVLEDLKADEKSMKYCRVAFDSIDRIQEILKKFQDIGNLTTEKYVGGEDMISFEDDNDKE